jgi:hypothetical protein
MLHVVITATFQNIHCANDVAVDIRAWVLNRITNTSLRCKVYNFLESLFGEEFFDCLPIGKIDAHHAKIIEAVENRRPRLF